MSEPEDRMVVKLKATSAVTTLVGSGNSARIRPVQLIAGDSMPAIVYQRIATEQESHSTGQANVAFATTQVTCLASTYDGAVALAAAVKGALSGWRDVSGSPAVSMCHLQNTYDIPQGVEPGQDVQTHGVAHDFYIQYATTQT